MARVLIFGSSGRSGQVMAEVARRRGYEVLAPTHAACDVLRPGAAGEAVLASGAGIVVNCAAVSSLEGCAEEPVVAHRLNAMAPAEMALACRHTGARFVHLSTDYVLDGRRPGLKDEGARCRPVCVYGESKREGELGVAEAYEESLCLRVSWLCGNPARPGFPEGVAARALAGQALAAIADKDSLPTDVKELAVAALQLAERGERGVFHVCATGAPMTWWQSAQVALQTLVDAGALPCLPALAEQRLAEVAFFREERPRHTAMDNAKLRTCGVEMSCAEETVRRAVLRWLAARG